MKLKCVYSEKRHSLRKDDQNRDNVDEVFSPYFE